MKLTPIFNAAAQGDGGQTPVDAGSPPHPNTGPTAIPNAPTDPKQPVDAVSTLIPAFNDLSILAPVAGPPPEAGQEPCNRARVSILDALEEQRAKPYLKKNLRPDPRVEQATHEDIEERRELFIAWLRAEIASQRSAETPEHDMDFEQDRGSDDFDPTL